MAKDVLNGRPVDITKIDDKIKIIFHPLLKNAKHPDAVMFTLTLSKLEIEKLKKHF
jgi:hypothetical protein